MNASPRPPLVDRLWTSPPGRTQQRVEVVVVALLVFFLLFAMMTTRPYNHDDEQYVTAGVLARHLTLYRDFAFSQPPFHPLVLSVIYRFLDGYYYLAARILSLVLALGSAVLGWFIAARITGSARVALLVPLLFATSTTLQSATGCCRNDMLPLALMLGSVAAVLCGWGTQRRGRVAGWMLLAGVLAALSLSSKQTFVFVPAGTLLYLLAAPRLPHRWVAAAAFAAGGLTGGLVDVYYLLVAGEVFPYLLVRYNVIVAVDWYTRAGLADDLAPSGRLFAAGRAFARDGVAPAALVVLLAGVVAAKRSGTLPSLARLASTPIGYLAALGLCSLPFVWILKPIHPQYFVPTFALMTLLAVSVLGSYPPPAVALRRATAAVLVAGMSAGTARAITFAPGMLSPASWVAMQIHADGLAIRAGAGGERICVATLSPLRALDVGLSIVPELAAGPFLFRSGEALGNERLRQLHGTSPSLLPELLDRRRPGAILLGFEEGWNVLPDAPLRSYARERGFAPGPPVGELWYGGGPGVGCVS